MEKVIVFIVTDNVNSQNVSRTSYLFSGNLFEIKVVSINLPDLPEDEECGRYGLKTWIDEDYYRLSWIMKQASQRYANSHILIIKDTVVTHTNSRAVEDIVSQLLSKEFDICYLSKWQDRCDLYTDFVKLEDCCSMLAKTFYPSGLQSVLISPKGREILLANQKMKNGDKFWDNPISINMKQKESEILDVTSDNTNSSSFSGVISHKIKVYKRYWGKYKDEECKMEDHLRSQIYIGNINAMCLVPNLFSFDITHSRSNDDYNKLCECQRIPYGEIRTENNYMSWAVLVIFIIILMIGIYLLLMK